MIVSKDIRVQLVRQGQNESIIDSLLYLQSQRHVRIQIGHPTTDFDLQNSDPGGSYDPLNTKILKTLKGGGSHGPCTFSINTCGGCQTYFSSSKSGVVLQWLSPRNFVMSFRGSKYLLKSFSNVYFFEYGHLKRFV